MNLPDEVQQVLIGSLLGDGCLHIPTRRQKARFYEKHSLRQLDYLKWKAEILTKFFGGWLSLQSNRVIFITRASPFLTEIRKKWYPNGKKIIPKENLEKLDSLGLAVWYLDDGTYNYRDRYCAISIDCFESQEVEIVEWFVKRWGLNPRIVRWGKPSRSSERVDLRFSTSESDKFLRLIAEHIRPPMIYKLGHLHPANQSRTEEIRGKKLEKLKRYYQKNRGKLLPHKREYQRKYYWDNRDKVLRYAHEYYLKNRQRICEYQRERKRLLYIRREEFAGES